MPEHVSEVNVDHLHRINKTIGGCIIHIHS